jgi:hypothetical protein
MTLLKHDLVEWIRSGDLLTVLKEFIILHENTPETLISVV